MYNGYIPLARKLKDWQWYRTPNMVQLWVHLLLSASTKEFKFQDMTIGRGQLKTGRTKLSEETGLSEQEVRTCLRRLERSGEISLKSTNKFTIITICKFDTYNPISSANQPTINQQLTSNQPATNQQLTSNQPQYNNNNNNIKIKNNKDINFCEDKSSLPDSNFAAEPPSAEPTFEEEVVPLSKEDFNFSGKSDVQVVEPELFAAPETVKNDNTANETSTAVQVYGTTETMPQMPKNTPKTTNTATPVAVQTAIPELTLRYDDIIAWFNKQVAMCAIPPVRVLNAKRKTNFRKCLKEFGRDKINQAVQMASRSKFLNGKNDRGFVADFDFIFNPNKLPRIIEGFYDREKADPAKVVVQKLANAGTMENYLAGNPLFDKNYFKNLNARKNGQQQQ